MLTRQWDASLAIKQRLCIINIPISCNATQATWESIPLLTLKKKKDMQNRKTCIFILIHMSLTWMNKESKGVMRKRERERVRERDREMWRGTDKEWERDRQTVKKVKYDPLNLCPWPLLHSPRKGCERLAVWKTQQQSLAAHAHKILTSIPSVIFHVFILLQALHNPTLCWRDQTRTVYHTISKPIVCF